MAEERRQRSKRWSERKGSSQLQRSKPREARTKTSRTQPKDEGRLGEEEELLRKDAGYEEETYFLQNSKRPKLPYQQKPTSLEVLTCISPLLLCVL